MGMKSRKLMRMKSGKIDEKRRDESWNQTVALRVLTVDVSLLGRQQKMSRIREKE